MTLTVAVAVFGGTLALVPLMETNLIGGMGTLQARRGERRRVAAGLR